MSRAPNAAVDLSSCDREPIHIPGKVQSFVELVSYPLVGDGRVDHMTATAPDLLPVKLGEPFVDALLPVQRQAFETALAEPSRLEGNRTPVFSGDGFEALVHVHQGRVLVELEPPTPPPERDAAWAQPLESVRRVVEELRPHDQLPSFSHHFAARLRHVLGYDRVMIYRFGEDWHGEVIAEARRPDLEPFLGLRYPASDIPSQARALFLANRLRIIGDVGDTPTALLASAEAAPLDMSYAIGRGVSPIHIEYLHNMGVSASLTMSLQRGGKLWGLVACHHYSGPKLLHRPQRVMAEFLAQYAELRIDQLLVEAERAELHRATAQLQAIGRALVEHDELATGLRETQELLLTLVGADGFVVWLDELALATGRTPPEPFIGKVVEHLRDNHGSEVFATDNLASVVPEAVEHRTRASGALVIPLAVPTSAYLLWFRAEEPQTVRWAGSPEKPAELGPNGIRLTPRKSFEAWVEQWHDRSRPWSKTDLEVAESLRISLSDVLFRERQRLLELTRTLELRNQDLDLFSSSASHDLREPLRGIANYATFLREDLEERYTEGLDEDLEQSLRSIDRLVKRMYGLIESLLMFSRFGAEQMEAQQVDLGELVSQVRNDLGSRLTETEASIEMVSALPTLRTWETGLNVIFTNLIGNALKYSDGPPRIELGVVAPEDVPPSMQGPGSVVLFVRDHGIGIDPAHHETVFRLFKRLHGPGQYGEGSGLGLAVVRRLVERMGGRITLHSEPGVGTTFVLSIMDLSEPGEGER